jgi:cell division protein FtsQ
VLTAVTVLVLVAVGVVLLLHSPVFEAKQVSVTGPHPHTATAEIVAAAGLAHHPPLIDVNPSATASRIEALPFVASARVSRHWPDRIDIAVTERVATETMAGPGSSWSELDGTGRTLAVDPARPSGLVELVVLGPHGGQPPAAVGRALPGLASPALEVCRTLPPAFAAQVVSVTQATDTTVSLALNSGLTVLLGKDVELKQKYEDVAAIIAHAPLRGVKIIDVTVPESPTTSNS